MNFTYEPRKACWGTVRGLKAAATVSVAPPALRAYTATRRLFTARHHLLRPFMAEGSTSPQKMRYTCGAKCSFARNRGFRRNLSIYTRLRAAIDLSIVVG